MGPEAANVDVGLGHLGMGEQEPRTEHGLSKHIEDRIGNDLLVDGGNASTVGNTPDDLQCVSLLLRDDERGDLALTG